MAKIIVQEQQESGSWKDLKECEGQNDARKYIRSIISSNCDSGVGLLWRHEPDKLRIIMPIAHCKTEVVFVDDLNNEVKHEDEKDEKAENEEMEDKEKEKAKETAEIKSHKGDSFSSNIDDKKIEEVKRQNKPKKTKKKKARKRTISKITGESYNEEKLLQLFFERCCELERWAKTTDFSGFDNENKYPTWSTFYNYLGGITNVIDKVAQKLKNNNLSSEYQELIKKYFGPDHSSIFVLKKLNKGTKKDKTTKSINYQSLNL